MPPTDETSRFDPALEHRLALEEARADNPRAAVERLTALIGHCPRHAAALSDLAVLLHGLGRSPEALTLLHRACSSDPDRNDAWENLLDLLGLLGRDEEARRTARTWLRVRPWEAAAHARADALGVLTSPLVDVREAVDSSDPARARRAWLDAVREDPGDPDLVDLAIELQRLETARYPGDRLPDGDPVREIEATDVEDLLSRRPESRQPFVGILSAEDPIGDLDVEALEPLATEVDLGNVRLLTTTPLAAARCRRAGLDVWAVTTETSPEGREHIRRELGGRTMLPAPRAIVDAVPATAPAQIAVALPFPESAVEVDLRSAVVGLLSRHLPDRDRRTFLDVETGEGRLLPGLATLGRVVATDPVAWRAKVAEYHADGLDVEIHAADPLDPALSDEPFGRFDAVTWLDGPGRRSRHEREGALVRIAEMLKEGGLAVLAFPNRDHPEVATGSAARTVAEIRHDARAFGFDLVEIVGVGRGLGGEQPLSWVAAFRPTVRLLSRPPEVDEAMLPRSPGLGRPDRPPMPCLEPLAAETPRPAAEIPPLLWCGALLTPGGYATYNRNSVLWLRRAGIQVGTRSHDEPNPDFLATLPLPDLFELKASLRDRIRNGIMLVNYQPVLPTGQNVYRQMRWQHPEQLAYVGLTTFETDTMPPHWVAAANEMDEIWVPSSFSIGAFERAGVERSKMKAIGFAIDPDLYDPSSLPPAEIPNRRGFVFYSVFQWHGRKGWRILIEAFARAFGPQDDVQLVLKTMPGANKTLTIDEQIDAYLAELGLSRDRVAPIHVIDHSISEEDLRRLYFAADAFVMPTRGEGWGIPYMEAMACGLPTIGTRWSGHLDYMNDENSYLIDIKGLVPVDREMLEFSREYTGQNYADPDVDHLVSLLRRLRDNPDEARARGERAYRDIREHWTPERYCGRVLEATCRLAARLDGRRRSEARPRDGLPPVSVRGSFFEATGHSHDIRTLAGQITHVDAALEVSTRFQRERIQPAGDADTVRLLDHALRPSVRVESGTPHQMQPPHDDAVNVARLTSWGDRLPTSWLPLLLKRDEVWAASRYHAEAYRRGGVPASRIRHVPVGVDLGRFHPEIEPLPVRGAKGVRFLACVDQTARKGLKALLEAFLTEFTPEDDVWLILKLGPYARRMPGEIRNQVHRMARAAARLRWGQMPLPITYLTEEIEYDDMPRLYRAADAYVLPAHAGSLGLTALEAMASGVPVVALEGGVHADFLEESTALLVETDRVPAGIEARREESELVGQQWAEPRMDDYRRKLREIASSPELRMRLCVEGRRRAEREHGLERVRDAVHEEMRRIGLTADGSRTSPPTVHVTWRGPQDDHGSLALVNHALTAELEASCDVSVGRRPAGDPSPVDGGVVVSHSWPPAFEPPAGASRHVLILPWEYGPIPAAWVQAIERGVDELWVPSHHVFEGMVAAGVPAEKIHVVPNGVDHRVMRPLGPEINLPTKKAFRFLYVGGAIWRKGLDALLDAYDRSFLPTDDVCLVVKTCGDHGAYRKCSGVEQLRVRAGMSDRPELVVIEEDLSDVEMAALYRACHVLAHPYRAEGFAMPVAEAAACGLGVIATRGGATTDFLREHHAFHVEAERVPFTTEAPYETDGWVLEPDLEDLARVLLTTFGNRREAKKRGRQASEWMRAGYRWRVVADIAASRLRALSGRDDDTTLRSDR